MIKRFRKMHIPVGLRTLKTAIAVLLALLAVEQYGASTAKMLFAVMGAIAAMEPTFKASVRNSIAQVSSVIVGVLLSLALMALELHGAVAAGLGIILVMAIYQMLHWKLSPVLPCLILVTICTDSSVNAIPYGFARIWDTTIGLMIGMLINMLVFPYDNSKKIRQAIAGLDEDLISFLKDLFDGDDHLPETEEMSRKIEGVEDQLALFANQRLLRRRRQKLLLNRLQNCEETAQALLIEVETLRSMECVGRLNRGNCSRLRDLGAEVSVKDVGNRFSVEDLVINYHVAKVLDLREKLKDELSKSKWK